MPLSDRPNPTDPGDAADLSIPQGFRSSQKFWFACLPSASRAMATMRQREFRLRSFTAFD